MVAVVFLAALVAYMTYLAAGKAAPAEAAPAVAAASDDAAYQDDDLF